MKPEELNEIIKGAFPGKRIVVITQDTTNSKFSVEQYGENVNLIEKIGMIESARIMSRIELSRAIHPVGEAS